MEKASDIISYYYTDKGISTDSREIRAKKYKEMLMATAKDALEIIGYGSGENIESEIFGTTRKLKRRLHSGLGKIEDS